jgi:ABC-2 type transport system ATP-binding protein
MTTSANAASSPSTPGDVVLDFRQVHKTFQDGKRRIPALRGVNLQARHGRITGLIGPDGAGKTTLLRLAAGLLEPDEGRVLALGMDATKETLAVQRVLGYMPQRFGLYEDLTVGENLNLYADLQRVPRADRPERYRELMHMTALAPFLDRLAGKLSGGMKQKLGLACTLVRSPRLLLLDEPTVGVDPVSRRELWAIINRLVHDEGVSVFVSTLYLDEAEHCHEVVILHEGVLLGQDTPANFSAPLRGRTWTAKIERRKPRAIQARLAGAAGVIDAVVQGERVRLVLQEGTVPETVGASVGLESVELTAVPPRFEDGFIALLRKRTSSGNDPPSEGLTPFHNQQTQGSSASASANRAVIEVRKLEKRFGDFYAVKNITFAVERGEVFGLLGANGAGKSTTFRMLCGLLPPSGGSLSVAGVDTRKAAAAARARLGYMSQKFSLYGNLSVVENLRFFSSAYGLYGLRRAARLNWAMEQFQLKPYADAASFELPLGYKQRLALACALMHEPDILFLDEPTSGVDPLARREFWQRINELAERGVTVLVTTHFMEEAEYCDRLAIMAGGQILALGAPADIKRRAATPRRLEPNMEEAFIYLIENAPSGEATP